LTKTRSALNKLLSRFVDLRPGEEKLVLLLFACFFLITCPHTIIKALRYADLLWKMGPGGLPYAYVAAAVVTGLVVVFHTRIHAKVSKKLMVTASLGFFVITGILLHLVLLTPYGAASAILSYLYWVWASVLTIVLMTQFWMIINDVFNPREAKRLIGFCGSGGILGGVAGGLLARFLTNADLANLLLPLACALLFACIFVVRAIYVVSKKKFPSFETSKSRQEQAQAPRFGFRDNFHAVRKNSYLRLISGLVIITVIVSTFIDFQFSSAVDDHFSLGYVDPKQAMQAFFGLFFAGLLVFSFLLNFFLTSKILKNFGIRLTLLLTPAVLLMCSFGIIFAPFTLLLAISIKGSDESLAFSLHQSVREILYIPVAPNLKARIKPFIDMFINRFAKVFAAILLLVIALSLNKELVGLTPVLDPDLSKDLIWAIIVLLVLWVIISLKIGHEYREAIGKNIQIKWGRVDKDVAEKLDIDYTKLVFDMIESKNRSSVLYAMHLYDLLEKDRLTPEIKEMISEKADEVKASSLGELFNAEGALWFPGGDDDIGQENFIKDIREIVSLDSYQQVMGEHAEQMMKEGEKSETERMEMAKAIGLMEPDAPLVKMLESLILDHSPEVSCYAIRSATRLQQAEHIPAIVQKLVDPKTHEEAISALKTYGHSAMATLESYLDDQNKDIQLRKAVVKVLANMGSQDAVRVLLRELARETEELEREIVDALDRIRSEKSDIHFPAKLAQKGTLSIIKRYCQTFIDLQGLDLADRNAGQIARLDKKLENLFIDIFKMLGLYYSHEDVVKVRQNLNTGTPNSVAYAIELLDNTLKKDMKDYVIPLVEDLSSGEKQKKFKKILKSLL
jgi:AAA family ATP:ADP antiporter